MSDLSNNEEVKDFIKTISEITKGGLQPKDSFRRSIKSEDLKIKAMYGRGEEFGVNKVQVVFFGNMELKPEDDDFALTSPSYYVYPEIPDNEYEPYLYASYRSTYHQQGIKNVRVGFYPKKRTKAAKEI